MRGLPSAGSVVVLTIGGAIAAGFAALFSAAGGPTSVVPIGAYLARVVAFSLAQATLSTALATAFGAALAVALSRRRFPGRGLYLAGLGAAAVMPAIVVVFATVDVFGRGGWLGALSARTGVSIFGWPGILFAHVLLNAPFVARVMLDALGTVPAEHWRLAQALGFGPLAVARHLDWPVLRAELAGVASLVFLLCFTSFAIVLTLGGGRATLEVAIYEALRVDLDYGRAAWLGLLQVAICLCVALALGRLFARAPPATTHRPAVPRPDRDDRRLAVLDALVLVLGAALVGPPLLSVAAGWRAIPAVVDPDFGGALATSLGIAALSAALSVGFAAAIAASVRRLRRAPAGARLARLYESVPTLVLAMPPFALAAGLYLLVRRVADPALVGYGLLPAVNALSALPFVYRFVAPAMALASERYARLADLLDLTGLVRFRIVDWPLLRRPLSAAAAMAMALSFGDFGVVALFGGSELRTLPYLLYERLGSYRLEEASAIGLVLMLAAFLLAYGSARWSHAAR
ncbi:MAG TPA: thiamine/thiamine pyrophosphate ABC transporter permease ThiP [Microvirga sp.]|nr:thiamine/thiamine pyrophosphate ABC transporter permease ThiP [Microvirga sp.]